MGPEARPVLKTVKAFALALCFGFGASPVIAFDLKLSSSSADKELNAAMKAASLLVTLENDEAPRGQEVLAAAQADYARLIGALYAQGYFAPVINIRVDGREAAEISPLTIIARVNRVDIRVVAGRKFTFGTAALGPLPPFPEPPASYRSGQPATTGAIQEAVDGAISDWRDAGYAKATLGRQQITARHAEARLDSQLQIAPGPALRFGELRISGNRAVRTERIRDIAGLPTGQIFSPSELARVTTRLRRTGAFKVAALSEAEEIGPGNTLPIDLQITEEKPRRFGFGAELSTSEGVALSGFWLHRNLLGGAERLRFDAAIEGIGGQTGGVDYSLGTRFTRPATFNEDTDFFALAELERLDEEEFTVDRFNIEAGITRYASPKRTFEFGIGLQHARTQDAFGDRNYTILTFPGSAEFDDRDNQLDATEGTYALLSLTPFAAIEGTKSGLRTYADLRGYQSFGENVVLAARFQLGSMVGPALSEAPTDFLFYSGGGGTVRGQEYQSLGVTLPSGREVGGRSFLGLSGEVRVKTTDSLSVVGFYDAGYIGEETFPDGSSGDWQTGAGFGVRYDTGIGPLRVDLGLPVSGPGDNNGFELYIGIGQAF
ncbi:MAG: autotransporter assembly complex protein TamA [Litoreibacter sp.]|nr:autotransporter assembly complex protein TamA [Litoreibacter sp.]